MGRSISLVALLFLSAAGFAQSPNASEVSVAKPGKAAAAEDALDKKVCRKSVDIGTLARISKTCLTRREWLAISDDAKQPWGELQGSKGMTSGQ